MRTIVLDRDGVINADSDDFIKSHQEFIPLPGSMEAIALLHKAGYRVLVASNQSGLARKYFDEYALAKIHHKLCTLAEDAGGLISGIFYCPHMPDDNCDCRKPKTGLLRRAEDEFDIGLSGCAFVGDSLRDLQAAKSHQMQAILVRTGNGASTESSLADSGLTGILVFDDLLMAVQDLLARDS